MVLPGRRPSATSSYSRKSIDDADCQHDKASHVDAQAHADEQDRTTKRQCVAVTHAPHTLARNTATTCNDRMRQDVSSLTRTEQQSGTCRRRRLPGSCTLTHSHRNASGGDTALRHGCRLRGACICAYESSIDTACQLPHHPQPNACASEMG